MQLEGSLTPSPPAGYPGEARSTLLGGWGEGDRPPFAAIHKAVEKVNKAKAPRAVVRSVAWSFKAPVPSWRGSSRGADRAL